MVAQSGGPEVGPIIPSLEAGIDWQPLAYNPDRKALYFMSNQWAMGYKFWAGDQFEPPTKGEWYLGGDYQQYLTRENPENLVGFDVVNRKVLWRVVSPAPFWAGAVATSSGLVFTGDMRGYFMAIEAESGKVLWQFQTGSGIIGSPITYELDGTQYVAVPSGGIGGDMTFYYTEVKAGNPWVFALDGGRPVPVPSGTNLAKLEGGLPRVGEPGLTLGGRILPSYGFPPTEGGEPIKTDSLPPGTASSVEDATNPFLGNTHAIAQGDKIYRGSCVGCHRTGGGAGPNVFKSGLPPGQFLDTVTKGRKGTSMPAFEQLLAREEIWQLHAFLMSFALACEYRRARLVEAS